MSNLSISARFFKSHLLELKSSYEKKINYRKNERTLFGFLAEFWTTPMITPVSFENKYHPDRNIWVVCIIPQKGRYDIFRLKDVNSGFSFDQVVAFLGDNLEKPVYVYDRNTFYPIYRNDIVEWNGQYGIFVGSPNHLEEQIDEKPLDGIEDLIKQAKYCVSIEEYHTEDGMSDPNDMDIPPERFYFSNLLSAKLFYNKKVARFMESALPDDDTNYNEFSQTSLSWHGWKSRIVDRFGPVTWADHLVISIGSVKIVREMIEGEYELV